VSMPTGMSSSVAGQRIMMAPMAFPLDAARGCDTRFELRLTPLQSIRNPGQMMFGWALPATGTSQKAGR
jgi:hypothetical protein